MVHWPVVRLASINLNPRMPTNKRPSKFYAPRTTADSGGGGSASVTPVYRDRAPQSYDEATGAAAARELVGFQDNRPTFLRVLQGLGGIQGPDITGMNAQLAMQDRATTAQRALEELRNEMEVKRIELGDRLSAAREQSRFTNDQEVERQKRWFKSAEQAVDLENAQTLARQGHQYKRVEQKQGSKLRNKESTHKFGLDETAANNKATRDLITALGLDPNDKEMSALAARIMSAKGTSNATLAERLAANPNYLNNLEASGLAQAYGGVADVMKRLQVPANAGDAVFTAPIPGVVGSGSITRGNTTAIVGQDKFGQPIKQENPARQIAVPDVGVFPVQPATQQNPPSAEPTPPPAAPLVAPLPSQKTTFSKPFTTAMTESVGTNGIQQLVSDEQKKALALEAYKKLMQELNPATNQNVIRF